MPSCKLCRYRKGVKSQGMWGVSRSRKKKENIFFSWSLQKKCTSGNIFYFILLFYFTLFFYVTQSYLLNVHIYKVLYTFDNLLYNFYQFKLHHYIPCNIMFFGILLWLVLIQAFNLSLDFFILLLCLSLFILKACRQHIGNFCFIIFTLTILVF